MKRTTTYALFGAIFAITVGTLGVSHISATTFGLAASVPATNQDGMKLTGHITLVATDPNGNIKAYRQTDNIVVNNAAYFLEKYRDHRNLHSFPTRRSSD